MTRRTLLGALAVVPVPLAGVARVRYQPQAGDVITGPKGARPVEVQEVFSLPSGTEMVWYFKGDVGLIASREQWQNMRDWDKARLA